ncbi:MAG: NAD(+) diphosphatase [Desulfotalea sp.]
MPLTNIDKSFISYIRFMGAYNETPCFVLEVLDIPSNKVDLHPYTLREIFFPVADDLFILAGKASQILSWHNDNKFCGKCGSPMTEHIHELAKECSGCAHIVYPRIAPVVIMTVERRGEILLGRGPHFKPGVYSPLAGYVEAGETFEEAVAREVKEEAGIEIDRPKYVASQAWPFPHSLMAGFRSEYKSGEIEIDTNELEDARWFSVNELPIAPTRASISRYLLELFIQDHNPSIL